ncbi:MAG: TonB-dependent receptor [Cyclobacteriaceae bacterium]|nr:TonB-dependent receptor [Cyclobacteriaceae bacterium]
MRTILASALLICSSAIGWAQLTVTGKVTDATGQPIPGANVQLKNTMMGTTTDADGNYSLEAPSAGVLIFSFIGYQTTELNISGKTQINVTLEEDVLALSEIVVIGYGVQKKSVATASMSKVESADLKGFSSARVDQIMQGQVAGVTFKSASGQPGSAQNIFIRGVGTNGNNNPLIIIDGVNSNDGLLAALNPDDIESIQILKDGASTAIYGSRAANGVIMVTTKKAKAGDANLNYSFFYGIQQPWKVPEMMDASQYVTAIREKYAAGNTPLPPGFPDHGSISTNTNWMQTIFEPASTQTHQLSVSKGSETSSTFASLSYFDQKGIIAPDKSNAQRITARLNSEQQINAYISFGQTLFFNHSQNERIPENNAFGSPISDALVYDPLTPVFDENGTFGFAQSPYVQKEYLNPLSRIFISNNRTSQDGLLGNIFLKISPFKNFFFKTDFGIDYNYYNGEGFAPSYNFFDTNGNQLPLTNELNDVYRYTSNVFIWQWENYMNYAYDQGKHHAVFTLGTTAREQSSSGFSGSSSGIPEEVQFNPNFQFIDNTPDSLRRSSGSASEREALLSFFGRINYNFDERYLFSASYRIDGSSKFGANNRFGFFPSVSAGWVISREQFWSVSQISFLKLRTSYGVNGNDRIGNLGYASLIGITGAYQFGKPGNQTIYQGLSSLFLDNPNLRWEESKQFDLGLEIGLLDDRLTIEFDYYRKTTSNLLMAATTALYIGNRPPTANVGEVVNQGFEMEANYRKHFKDVLFNIGFNATTLTNKVTQVTDNGFIDGYTWPVRNTVITRMEVGQPIGYFRGYRTGGVFNNQSEIFSYINSNGDPIQPNAKPGDLKFIDVNGDGIIDEKDITNIGKPWPDFILGLNLSASYKGFDARILFSASIGNDIFRSYERQDVPNNNYQVEWLNRWTESNPNGSYPRLTTADTNNNSRPSDFYVEDGSYLRLKTLQLGYTLPAKIISKAKMKTLRLYAAIDNLLTLTGYTGLDPEIGSSGWILDTSIDKGFYPQLKTVGFGLNASF